MCTTDGGIIYGPKRKSRGIIEVDESPEFLEGELVRVISRQNIKGYVKECGPEKTTIIFGFGKIAIYRNILLERVKKGTEKKQKQKGSRKKKRRGKKPLCPGIFVDACIEPRQPFEEIKACICAVVVGSDGDMLFYAVEHVSVKRPTDAEIQAISLGEEIRFNESWPIYCDYRAGAEMSKFDNVKWVPREDNGIAHELAVKHREELND